MLDSLMAVHVHPHATDARDVDDPNLNNHTDIHSDSTNNSNISDISNNHHGTSNNNLHNNTLSTTFFSSQSRSRLNDARF
jgi:hypothetical protein